MPRSIPRPLPPAELADPGRPRERFLPAPEVAEWVRATFIESGGALENPDHAHLVDAEIDVLWTSAENTRNMRQIAGTAELVNLKGLRWSKARERFQLLEWFGRIPDFLITLDAVFSAQMEDIDFCCLSEHELYHCGQKEDEHGAPRFDASSMPLWALRGHDVEEHLGVVRRYGARGAAAELVRLAQLRPQVRESQIAVACGTCGVVV